MGPVLRLERARRSGTKAGTLARLARLGFAVPDAWVVPPALVDAPDLAARLRVLPDDGTRWAVRSSADVEDGSVRSWAGQFRTVLDVCRDEVSAAVVDVAHSAARAVYGDDADPAVAVVVQRMVHPHVAGVVFSRNPVTGMRETVVEAVPGTGDGLVAGRVEPERWVRRNGQWRERPPAPHLEVEVAGLVADGADRMERALGFAVDAEWAWDGTLWWLQARPITTGTRPAVYSSRMARDMLPGVVLPLVWSVNGPVVSRAFLAFLEDVLGPLDVRPEELSTLIHHRFYINIGALSRLFAEFGLPEDSLERLAGMEAGSMPPMRPTPTALRRLPRLARATGRYAGFGKHLDARLPQLWQRARARAAGPPPGDLAAAELLDRVDRLAPLVTEIAFHHVVTLMLLQMHSAWARSTLTRRGSASSPVDMPAGDPSDNDLGAALRSLADVVQAAPPSVGERVRAGDLAGLRDDAAAAGFVAAFDGFMDRFGHFSDSAVNFTCPTWAEEPDRVLAMVAAALDVPARDGSAHLHTTRPPWVVRRVAAYSRRRDETSSLYAYAYGQYRPLVLALGERLSEVGALDDREDIFHLTLEEVRRVVVGGLEPAEARGISASRAADIAATADWELPEVVVGDVVDHPRDEDTAILRGIGVSRGMYTGRVAVCRGLADLGALRDGDVVVVPYSDASWTPLFLRAGAIVAESGGMLSHSAILARELAIPAVTSVRGALALRDGELVTVDGSLGAVLRVDTGD